MYTVYYGNTKIHDPENGIFLISAKLDMALNQAGTFTFETTDETFYVGTGHAVALEVLLNNLYFVRVYRFGSIIWRGRVLSISTDELTGINTVTCEGMLSFLNDYYLPPYTYEGTPANYLAYLMNHAELSDDYEAFLLHAGTCDVVDPNDYIVRSNSEYSNLYEELMAKTAGSTLGGYIGVRLLNNYLYVDWTATPNVAASTQEIEYGTNMLSMVRGFSGEKLFGAILPLGADMSDDSSVHNYVTIETATDEDPSGFFREGKVLRNLGLSESGVIGVKVMHWPNVTTPNALLKKAAQAFETDEIEISGDWAYYIPSISAEAIDLADAGAASSTAFRLGAETSIEYGDSQTAQQYLTKMTLDLLHPESSTFSFGALPDRISQPGASESDEQGESSGDDAHNATHGYLTQATGFAGLAGGIRSVDAGRAGEAFGDRTSIPQVAYYYDPQMEDEPDTDVLYFAKYAYAGHAAHAEGSGNVASGALSHAEGGGVGGTIQSVPYTPIVYRMEGAVGNQHARVPYEWFRSNEANGKSSHAEGSGTFAGMLSHAEGWCTKAAGAGNTSPNYKVNKDGSTTYTLDGMFVLGANHSEGISTYAGGSGSHAQGIGTFADGNGQTVIGTFNEIEGYSASSGYPPTYTDLYDPDDDFYEHAFIIGNGTSNDNRSNAFAVDWDGNVTCGLVNGVDVTNIGPGGGNAKLLAGYTAIAEDDDLNDYNAPGNYAASTNALAETLAHAPVSVAFSLEVGKTINSSTSGQYLYQRVIAFNSPDVWYRYRVTGSWGSWYRSAPYSTSAATANRFLATPNGTAGLPSYRAIDQTDLPSGLCWYGTCSTTASTAKKEVTCSGFTLTAGAMLAVYFSTGSTAATPTLDVNGTGEKSIYYNNNTATSTVRVIKWSAYSTLLFVYDGSAFRYLSKFPDDPAAWYGTSSTAASTAAKAVTCANYRLTAGATVTVRFSEASTANAPTLNVNSTGAKAIYVNDAAASSTNPLKWSAGETMTFVYSGSYYYLVSRHSTASLDARTYDVTSLVTASTTSAASPTIDSATLYVSGMVAQIVIAFKNGAAMAADTEYAICSLDASIAPVDRTAGTMSDHGVGTITDQRGVYVRPTIALTGTTTTRRFMATYILAKPYNG